MQDTILEALDSALAQTVPCEIIVSDDSSGDESLQRIAARVRDYRGPHRVRVRNLSDGGMMGEGQMRVQRGHRVSVELRNIGAVGAVPGGGEVVISAVAPLSSADRGAIAFLGDRKFAAALAATRVLRELDCPLFEGIGLIALDDLDWYPLVGSGIGTGERATLPATPLKCAGAPLKMTFMLRDRLAQAGTLGQSEVHFHSALGNVFGVKPVNDNVLERWQKLGIQVHTNEALAAVDIGKRIATFASPEGERTEVPYTPPASGRGAAPARGRRAR